MSVYKHDAALPVLGAQGAFGFPSAKSCNFPHQLAEAQKSLSARSAPRQNILFRPDREFLLRQELEHILLN
jgi:hypothetical protein